jgi:hypothetical protein
MKVRIYVDDNQITEVFKRASNRWGKRGRDALRASAKDVATEIETEGRADIERAGRFGSRWIDGFHADISEGGGQVKIDVIEDVPYWTVFEYGAVIRGKPLLWIPLPFAQDAQGIWARDYPGRLFRVDRTRQSGAGWRGQKRNPTTGRFAGGYLAPLLLSAEDKQPKYFGKESVTIPQKFHLRPISLAAAKKLPLLFKAKMKATRNG